MTNKLPICKPISTFLSCARRLRRTDLLAVGKENLKTFFWLVSSICLPSIPVSMWTEQFEAPPESKTSNFISRFVPFVLVIKLMTRADCYLSRTEKLQRTQTDPSADKKTGTLKRNNYSATWLHKAFYSANFHYLLLLIFKLPRVNGFYAQLACFVLPSLLPLAWHPNIIRLKDIKSQACTSTRCPKSFYEILTKSRRAFFACEPEQLPIVLAVAHNSIDISHAGEIIADNGHINPSSEKTTPATTTIAQFILTILFLFHNFLHLRPETVTGSPTQSRSQDGSRSEAAMCGADHEDISVRYISFAPFYNSVSSVTCALSTQHIRLMMI